MIRRKPHISGIKLESLYTFGSIGEMLFPYTRDCCSRSTEASKFCNLEIQRITVAITPSSPIMSFH